MYLNRPPYVIHTVYVLVGNLQLQHCLHKKVYFHMFRLFYDLKVEFNKYLISFLIAQGVKDISCFERNEKLSQNNRMIW